YRTPFERFARYTPCGTPAEVAGYLKPYVAAGCSTLNLTAPAEHWEEAVEGLAEVRRLLNT
ncbi:MAG: LLM class flavin-dependent oxidoreductase, partial [Dehalococcoidia bacterium]